MSALPTTGSGGLPKLVLSHPSGAAAEVYLHGGHLTSWVPAGATEAIFTSRAARFEAAVPIRGGIPVVFPQFAELGPLPKHGFARVLSWSPSERAGRDPSLALELRDSPATRDLWPHEFRAELTVELEAHALVQRLSVRNPGPEPFSFTGALHTYLRVADARESAVEGLQGARYRDRASWGEERVDREPRLSPRGELDRAYLDAPDFVTVLDGPGQRSFLLSKRGFADLVVWNPGPERAASFDDMEDGEYLEMLCVEVAQVLTPIELPPGASWEGSQRILLVPGAPG